MAVMLGIREYVLCGILRGPLLSVTRESLKPGGWLCFYMAVWRYLLFHVLAALVFFF